MEIFWKLLFRVSVLGIPKIREICRDVSFFLCMAKVDAGFHKWVSAWDHSQNDGMIGAPHCLELLVWH